MLTPERTRAISANLGAAASAALLIVLAIAPLPLGSNRDWAWSPMAVLVAIALLAHAAQLLGSSRLSPVALQAIVIPAVAMTLVIVWSLLQVVDLPWVSNVQPVLPTDTDALGGTTLKHIAIDSERALTGTMRLLTYCGVFWLAATFSTRAEFAQRLCLTIVVSGILVTAYGFVMQVTTRSCVVLTIVKRPLESGDPCSFSGTFVNSANYATYAGLAALVCIAQILALLAKLNSRSVGAAERWRAGLLFLAGRGGVWAGTLAILLGGLIYSASRAGFFSFFLAAVCMVTALNALQRRSFKTIVWSLIATALFTATVLTLTGEGIANRALMLLSLGDTDRVSLYALSLQAISIRPFTGWGLGSFEAVYSILQPSSIPLTYDRAHDVYLENAIDLGIPAACLLVLAVLAIAWRCVRGIGARSRDAHYPALAFGATVLVGFHGFVNFDVQIPAIAMTYCALLGMGWIQSWSSRVLSEG